MADISFSGLASGIDVGSIIDKLVAVDSVPITTLKDKQSTIKNKKEVWNEINSTLLGLQESLVKVSKTLLGGAYSSSVGNENIVSASVNTGAITGSYNINVTQLAQNLVVTGDKFEGEIGKSGTIVINDGLKDIEITIEDTDTVDSISKKINNASGNVKSYVLDGRLVLSHKLSGEQSNITIKDDSQIFSDLGIVNSDGTLKNISQEAKNAIVSVNGIEVTRSSNSISDLIPGVTLNLKLEGETRINIEDNLDEMVNSINEFIKSYNNTMNIINTKLSEAIPEEVTTTNKKQGLLKGNSTLNQIKNKLRQNVLGKSTSADSYNYLYQMGIDASKDNYGKDGTLQLVDETKLRDVLQNDREKVINFFIQDVDGDGKVSDNDKGLLSFLNTYIDELSSSSSTKKGTIVQAMDSLESRIKALDKDIERKEAQVEAKRLRYEKQFTAMEVRVSNLNANGDSLINSMYSMLGY